MLQVFKNCIIFYLVFICVYCVYSENIDVQVQKKFYKSEQFEAIIENIIQEMQYYSKCIIYITDSYYEKMVDIGHMKSIHDMPLFKMFIHESEIFSLLKTRLNSIFMETLKSGCNSYVILMSNGIQVMNLLRYLERERLIDTRGYFLCMYDTRILRPEMSYLWNRILNVIFLRKYTAFYHKTGLLKSREWISLETVNFPVPSNKFVITKSIDIWDRKRFFSTRRNHFVQKAIKLDNQKMSIAVFEHFPAVVNNAVEMYENQKLSYEKKPLGIEFEMILYIARAMNFEPQFYTPENIKYEKWGVQINGSYNGLLGEVVKERASFYLGEFHNTLKYHHLIDLSQPYTTECFTFLTPELLSDTSWKLLIVPFTLSTWVAVILTLILASVIVYFFSLFYKNYISYNKCFYIQKITADQFKTIVSIEKEKAVIKQILKEENLGLYLFTEVQNSALYIYSMLLQVSLPMLPRAWAVRVFIGCWWMYSILIAVAYRASLTASLANPIEKKTIDTVTELAKSSVRVGGWIAETKEFSNLSNDLDIKKIANTFEIINNETEAIELVANGEFAYYDNIYLLQQSKVFGQMYENEKQMNTSKESSTIVDRNLHVMKECLIYMPVSFAMDKNSALKPRVDFLVQNAIEVGLVAKWLSDVMEWTKIAEKKQETEPVKALVNFQKLQGALVALGIGYFLSLFAFIYEVLHFKYVVLRDPRYDKYNLEKYYSKDFTCFRRSKQIF